MKCKTKKKKYANGGELSSLAPQLLNMAMPGLGTVATPIVGALVNQMKEKNNTFQILQDQLKSINVQTNPYYENGGVLEGREGAEIYNGLSHLQNGIDVNAQGVPSPNPVAEVENAEVKYRMPDGKHYIFSKKLKLK